MANDTVGNLLTPMSRNRDLALVVAIIGILVAILIPLPPALMDLFLITNMTISLLILLTTIYVAAPLEFSVFPSLLLITTLFRLALNVATTRLILGRAGEDGPAAAGKVVQVFGEFVAGHDALVGFIIFSVIVVIQFVVITKGATRIAEVAARFTLDKMPGQQLSIDADLNAGLIKEDEARKRRARINAEADFYGAMDGASKFVRGDAIAGIIITLINIVGGLIIGMVIHKMEIGQALQTYTILTIGDGLVTQIPALVVSIAAGLIVTRTTAASNLGVDLVSQMFSSPRAVLVTGAFLVLLLPTALPAWLLVSLIIVFGVTGFLLSGAKGAERRREEDEKRKEAARDGVPRPEQVAPPAVDPLELEVGYGLVNLVDPGDGGGLLHRVAAIREQIATELGLVIPAVRIRDNMQFRPDEYCIKLRGQRIGRGEVRPHDYLAMDAGLNLEPIAGVQTKEPAFGIPAVWITEENKGRAEAIGYTVVDTPSVMATHLTEVIRDHAAEILTREEVNRMLERVREKAPAVVKEVLPEVLKIGEVQKVLQNLLRERISIRDLEAILECLADWAPRTRDVEVLTEYVRHTLARTICGQFAAADGRVHVVTIDPELEDYVQNATEHSDRGSLLRLSPEIVARIVQAISKNLEKLVGAGHPPIVLSAPQVRLQVRRMLETAVPGVVVLSYNEVAKGVVVESMGVARIE